MFHTIEFAVDFTVDMEVSRKKPLERVCMQKGTRRRAQLRPYITETTKGPIEVADLFFEDGFAIRMVPYAWFSFLDLASPN